MNFAARRRAFVIIEIVAVAGQRGIGASPEKLRANGPAELVALERVQQPTASRVGGFHLERAIGLARMADDFVSEEGVEVRIGDYSYFTIGRPQYGDGGKLAGLVGEIEREIVQVRMWRQFVA